METSQKASRSIPFASAAGSALSITAGRLGGDPARSFRHDALSAFGLFVGVTVEQIEPEKVRVSLQVLPPGISYVVTQQDRSVVVKVVRTE